MTIPSKRSALWFHFVLASTRPKNSKKADRVWVDAVSDRVYKSIRRNCNLP
jgi:hypothetical protein